MTIGSNGLQGVMSIGLTAVICGALLELWWSGRIPRGKRGEGPGSGGDVADGER